MATMTVEVVSAERKLWSGEASEVYARSLDGEIGILPGHQPALLALDIAPVTIKTGDAVAEKVAVHHGFLYFRNNHLVILADTAELATEIDVSRAEGRLRELEARRNELSEDAEVEQAEESIRKQRLRAELGR